MRCFVEPPVIFLHPAPVGFRKSINGLVILVEHTLDRNPFDPALYLSCNRGRDKMKILYWDTTGFALWYKRLEKARFKWPIRAQETTMQLDEQQLEWLLNGYDIIGDQPLFFQKVS